MTSPVGGGKVVAEGLKRPSAAPTPPPTQSNSEVIGSADKKAAILLDGRLMNFAETRADQNLIRTPAL
jgi:hypothetical protein